MRILVEKWLRPIFIGAGVLLGIALLAVILAIALPLQMEGLPSRVIADCGGEVPDVHISATWCGKEVDPDVRVSGYISTSVPGTYKRQRDPIDGKMKNGRYYTASAPGEPPAVRLGHFRESWHPYARRVYGVYFSRIESDLRVSDGKYNLGQLLENGTSRMAPRPFEERIIKHAENRINRIYSEPYNI